MKQPTVLALLFVGLSAFAQSIVQQPSTDYMGVVQFGNPGDSKFIFCATDECPEVPRKVKKQTLPPPPLPIQPTFTPDPIPEPQAVEPPAALKVVKKKKKRKPVSGLVCVPRSRLKS